MSCPTVSGDLRLLASSRLPIHFVAVPGPPPTRQLEFIFATTLGARGNGVTCVAVTGEAIAATVAVAGSGQRNWKRAASEIGNQGRRERSTARPDPMRVHRCDRYRCRAGSTQFPPNQPPAVRSHDAIWLIVYGELDASHAAAGRGVAMMVRGARGAVARSVVCRSMPAAQHWSAHEPKRPPAGGWLHERAERVAIVPLLHSKQWAEYYIQPCESHYKWVRKRGPVSRRLLSVEGGCDFADLDAAEACMQL